MRVEEMMSNPAGSLTVYLAGPVEDSDDPNGWRARLEYEKGFINFINPMKLGWEKGTTHTIQTTLEDHDIDREKLRKDVESWREGHDMFMIQNCKRGLTLSDAVLINWKHGESSVGTHWEQCIAWRSGLPVAVVVPEDVDPYEYLHTFMYYHADTITTTVEEAIDDLYTLVNR